MINQEVTAYFQSFLILQTFLVTLLVLAIAQEFTTAASIDDDVMDGMETNNGILINPRYTRSLTVPEAAQILRSIAYRIKQLEEQRKREEKKQQVFENQLDTLAKTFNTQKIGRFTALIQKTYFISGNFNSAFNDFPLKLQLNDFNYVTK